MNDEPRPNPAQTSRTFERTDRFAQVGTQARKRLEETPTDVMNACHRGFTR